MTSDLGFAIHWRTLLQARFSIELAWRTSLRTTAEKILADTDLIEDQTRRNKGTIFTNVVQRGRADNDRHRRHVADILKQREPAHVGVIYRQSWRAEELGKTAQLIRVRIVAVGICHQSSVDERQS